jgi:hypothetical protein
MTILLILFAQEAIAQNNSTLAEQSTNATEGFIVHKVDRWGTYALYTAIGIAAAIVGIVIWKRRKS